MSQVTEYVWGGCGGGVHLHYEIPIQMDTFTSTSREGCVINKMAAAHMLTNRPLKKKEKKRITLFWHRTGEDWDWEYNNKVKAQVQLRGMKKTFLTFI